jgi:hypothetical protein
MAPLSAKKRKIEDGMRGKTDRPKKRIRKQKEYHSSSEDEDEQNFAPVNLADSDDEIPAPQPPKLSTKQKRKRPAVQEAEDEDNSAPEDQGADSSASTSDGDDAADTTTKRKSTSKRNNPEAFSTSLQKILGTKLPTSSRSDPVLSRSRSAQDTSTSLANDRLEAKARAKIRADKREELERGRIKDVTGIESGKAGETAEEEKRLRKIAQRGVVKLFNAVRMAQVKADQAAREERKKGTVGMANRADKVNQVSKKGFLDLISGGKRDSSNQSSTPI